MLKNSKLTNCPVCSLEKKDMCVNRFAINLISEINPMKDWNDKLFKELEIIQREIPDTMTFVTKRR